MLASGCDGLESMQGLMSGPTTTRGFVGSAIMLTACTVAVALVLAPIAAGKSGSSGPLGLIAAAAVCLLSGLAADCIGSFVTRTSPVGAALVGMMIRMIVPLGVCVALLASGQSGRDHLPFIGYLLTFYMVVLALETWLAVKRSAQPPTNSNRSVR
jgi:hypothetical protein